MIPFQLEEEQNKFSNSITKRKKNVYQYLSNHVSFKSNDIEGERSNLYTSIDQLFKSIANCRDVILLRLFNTIDDEAIGKFLLSSIEDKRNSNARTSFANLKKSYEVDFRSCVDGKYTEYAQTNFLNFYKQEFSSTDDPLYATHVFFVALYFTYLLQEHSSYTKRRLFPPKSILLDSNQIESICYLNIYYRNCILPIKNAHPCFFEYLFKPYDLFYMLIINASEDLIREVDNCFDYLALHEKNLDNLFSFKNKIEQLINKYEILISHISSEDNCALNMDNFDCINTKRNRDSIFNSFSFLYEAQNIANEFSILNKNGLDNKLKSHYYREGQNKPINFEYNLENVKEFLNTYPFFNNSNHVITDKGLPSIGLFFESHSAILEKVLFHEFSVNHSEHRTHQIHGITKSHSSSLLQLKLTTIIDQIVLALKNTSENAPNFEDKNRGIFLSVKVSLDKNTRNTDLYTLSVYMTEKIRRGYYREHQMMDWYKTSFQISSKLKQLFIKLLFIKNITASISLLYNFSLSLDIILVSYL